MEVSENVKINFEERLNNLLNTRDITVYLECLLALREKYLIVAAVKDTLGSNIPEKAFNILHEIGFTQITSVLHKMYVGVCGKGSVIADIAGERPDDVVAFDGNFDGVELSVSSKSWSKGNIGDILINGINFSLKSRGLNIVIFDCEKNEAVDSVGYDSYIATPTFYHKNLEFDDAFFDSHFYIPEKYIEIWKEPYSKKYFNNRTLNVQEVENGIILPNKVINDAVYGGVCDENFNFISGHRTFVPEKDKMTRHISGSYKVASSEIKFYDEIVIYGGTMPDHPGHLIVEAFADRIWWFVKNNNSYIKIAIVDIWGDGSSRFSKEFLELFGISEDRIIICSVPSQFKRVIVPEQSSFPRLFYFPYDYTTSFYTVYSHMAENVPTSGFKKVYFAKSLTAKGNIVGEDFFIDFYKRKGFEIVYPENHSLKEKISFLKGADEFVTQIGTNAHYAIFCKPTVKLTILSRVNDDPVSVQALLNEAAHIKNIYCVDVSMCFLQKKQSWGVAFIGVTNEFGRYVKEVYCEEPDITPEQSLRNNLYDYLKTFVSFNSSNSGFGFIKNQKMLTILQNMSEVFLGKEFDTSKLDLTTNEDVLNNRVKHLSAELDRSKKRIVELENSDIYKAAKLIETTNTKLEKQIAKLGEEMHNMRDLQTRVDELSVKNAELERSLLNAEYDAKQQKKDYELLLEKAKEQNELAFLEKTELQGRIDEYEMSSSWRITKPMRAIVNFFGRLFGKSK